MSAPKRPLTQAEVLQQQQAMMQKQLLLQKQLKANAQKPTAQQPTQVQSQPKETLQTTAPMQAKPVQEAVKPIVQAPPKEAVQAAVQVQQSAPSQSQKPVQQPVQTQQPPQQSVDQISPQQQQNQPTNIQPPQPLQKVEPGPTKPLSQAEILQKQLLLQKQLKMNAQKVQPQIASKISPQPDQKANNVIQPNPIPQQQQVKPQSVNQMADQMPNQVKPQAQMANQTKPTTQPLQQNHQQAPEVHQSFSKPDPTAQLQIPSKPQQVKMPEPDFVPQKTLEQLEAEMDEQPIAHQPQQPQKQHNFVDNKKKSAQHFTDIGFALFHTVISAPELKCDVSLSFDCGMSCLGAKPPADASVILKFGVFKKQSVSFASIVAVNYGMDLNNLGVDLTNYATLLLHDKIISFPSQPAHVAKAVSIDFSSGREARSFTIALNFLLRAHRRSNPDLYKQNPKNKFVMKESPSRLAVIQWQSDLEEYKLRRNDDENTAVFDVCNFIFAFCDMKTVQQVNNMIEEGHEVQYEIVYDGAFNPRYHSRFAFFSFAMMKKQLKDILLGDEPNIQMALQFVAFVDIISPTIQVFPHDMEQLNLFKEMLGSVSEVCGIDLDDVSESVGKKNKKKQDPNQLREQLQQAVGFMLEEEEDGDDDLRKLMMEVKEDGQIDVVVAQPQENNFSQMNDAQLEEILRKMM